MVEVDMVELGSEVVIEAEAAGNERIFETDRNMVEFWFEVVANAEAVEEVEEVCLCVLSTLVIVPMMTTAAPSIIANNIIHNFFFCLR